MGEPAWVEHAIWWHIYPLGFVGAFPADQPPTPDEHRLSRVVEWLDHAVALGASGIALGPIFASRTHGYDTTDHFRIDPRLGDDGDFDHLVTEAHGRGLRILLDGVFNHVGTDFARYREAVDGGPEHPASAWFRRRGADFDTFEGHGELIALNHANPEVVSYTADVMRHWLGRGADGWRLDAAYAVPDRFWAQVLPLVRRDFGDAWFVGEVIHGDYPATVTATGFDSLTQYELWKAIWSSLNDRNMWELAWGLQRHDEFAATTTMQTFVGNHDVTRIASQVGDAGAALAAAVLLTVPGMPSIYYGDEQAFRGTKATGVAADDPVRPPLPERPELLDSAGWWLYRWHQELIGLRRRNPWLSTGRLSVLDKTDTTITYAVRADGHELRTSIDITGDPRVDTDVDGARALSWPR